MAGRDALAVYLRLYNQTVLWAAGHVSERAAHKVVRHSLARLFQLAMTAWETPDGPFAELREIAAPQLLAHGSLEGVIKLPGGDLTALLPSVSDLRDYCELYAAVYEVAYFGQWSTPTREYFAMLMRQERFVHLDDDGQPTLGEFAVRELPYLNQALSAHEDHSHGDHVVCAAALSLFDDQRERSLNWLERQGLRKGGEQWPG